MFFSCLLWSDSPTATASFLETAFTKLLRLKTTLTHFPVLSEIPKWNSHNGWNSKMRHLVIRQINNPGKLKLNKSLLRQSWRNKVQDLFPLECAVYISKLSGVLYSKGFFKSLFRQFGNPSSHFLVLFRVLNQKNKFSLLVLSYLGNSFWD